MNRTGAQFNRVSGRKEHGSAVTAKVYTLGNSFELCGRDFYERDQAHNQAIKENRLNANERRRRANRLRAQAERQAARAQQAPQGRVADRFGYQKNRQVGPGPTTATIKEPAPLPGRGAGRSGNSASRRRKPQNAQVRRSTSANRHQRDGGARRHRVPSQAPVTRKKDGAYNAEPAASVRARVSEGEIGIAISGEEREHATSLALARRMQRGGGHSSRDSARRRGHSSPRAAEPYQQKKNTRKRDEYLSLLLGKAPADDHVFPPMREGAPIA